MSNRAPVSSRERHSHPTMCRCWTKAYHWLCQQRRDYPPDADVWELRFHWHAERIRFEAELRSGRFRFGPLSVITTADGEVLHLWSARDALVLKALALVVGPLLQGGMRPMLRRLAKALREQHDLSPRCVHVKGHGLGHPYRHLARLSVEPFARGLVSEGPRSVPERHRGVLRSLHG